MKLIDAVPAVFMVALSASILLGTSHLPYWQGTTPGPAFFPVWLAGAGLILGFALLVSLYRGPERSEPDLPDRSAAIRVALTTLAMVALALFADTVGMVGAVVLFLAFLLLVVLRQRLLPSLITVVVTAAAIELVLVRWLSVPLPETPFL